MKKKAVREPIATWWKIDSYKVEILPVKVVAFTAAFVTYLEVPWTEKVGEAMETRERRSDIFPTFQEAKEEAVQRASAQVVSLQERLHREKTALGQWASLQEP
jgi:hypothetical protein